MNPSSAHRASVLDTSQRARNDKSLMCAPVHGEGDEEDAFNNKQKREKHIVTTKKQNDPDKMGLLHSCLFFVPVPLSCIPNMIEAWR